LRENEREQVIVKVALKLSGVGGAVREADDD
jgi:hypothetical protein